MFTLQLQSCTSQSCSILLLVENMNGFACLNIQRNLELLDMRVSTYFVSTAHTWASLSP